MVPLIAFKCVLEPVRQRKKIFNKKHKIFLFQVFDFWFFTKIFILQQSESESELFFGFGSSQNIRLKIQILPALDQTRLRTLAMICVTHFLTFLRRAWARYGISDSHLLTRKFRWSYLKKVNVKALKLFAFYFDYRKKYSWFVFG
jgi:hypothetical protein